MQEKRFGNGWMKMVEKAKGQNQLVSCLERQSEKPLCDWIKATGVGLLRPGLWDLEAERLEKMMDGDVSHSSELKLLTLGVEVVAEVVCTIVFLFLLLHCYVYKLCVYFSFFSPFFS
jgi:hypothetical protein